MAYLFKSIIDGKSSWGEIFGSIDAFEALINAIFLKHGLCAARIENLTPGTNAVFCVGDKVIKIFAPIESGFYDADYYAIERAAQIHAGNVQITAPRLLYSGMVEDKYLFRYIIMEFINGQEAEHKLLTYSDEMKKSFALQIKGITSKLNIQIEDSEIPSLTLNSCLNNNRWDIFPESFRDDRRKKLEEFSFKTKVYVHGDLTAENMIIDDNGMIYIIDFADSLMAPPCYELPALVFALFGCDQVMLTAYFDDYHTDEFYEELTFGLLIHEYGAGIIKQICERRPVSLDSIADVSLLKSLVSACLEDGDGKVK